MINSTNSLLAVFWLSPSSCIASRRFSGGGIFTLEGLDLSRSTMFSFVFFFSPSTHRKMFFPIRKRIPGCLSIWKIAEQVDNNYFGINNDFDWISNSFLSSWLSFASKTRWTLVINYFTIKSSLFTRKYSSTWSRISLIKPENNSTARCFSCSRKIRQSGEFFTQISKRPFNRSHIVLHSYIRFHHLNEWKTRSFTIGRKERKKCANSVEM